MFTTYTCRWACSISSNPGSALFKCFDFNPSSERWFSCLSGASTFLGCFLESTAIASTIFLELLLHRYDLSPILPRLALAGWCKMHHWKLATNTATTVYCEIQRAFLDDDGLNQHCVNLFGKGLNVTDVRLYVKVPHSTFKALKLYWTSV